MIATVSFAQSSLVATLTHGDDIQMYYGTYAYQQAINAAVDGDVINLSGGSFQSINITKSVTVRGAGVDAADPTFIIGNFDINIPAETTGRLSMEGVRVSNTITAKGTLNNAYFLKDNIAAFNTYNASTTNVKNTLFANCRVNSTDWCGNTGLQFVNCYVGAPNNSASSTASAAFVNCVIRPIEGYYASYIKSSSLINCILVFSGDRGNSPSYYLPSSTSAINCIAVGYEYAFFGIVAGQNNKPDVNKNIFVDSNEFNDLTEEAKALYLGNDGTPVGMYGGILPYNTTPSYPQITKMNVANKTTADGKLSVDIEVSATE